MDKAISLRFDNVSRSKTFRNIINKHSLGNKRVLDIGCTYGEFLKHFGDGSVGLTIMDEEVKVGKSLGYDIRFLNIEHEHLEDDRKFDVIFANNLFEHMQSPHNFLINIKQYLNENGVLILGVPCMPYIGPLIHLRKFRGSLADTHVNFFTRSTLKKTVEYAGWKIIETRGFRFANRFIDHLLDPIYPHFYVVAYADEKFHYSDKKLKELEGYGRYNQQS